MLYYCGSRKRYVEFAPTCIRAFERAGFASLQVLEQG